MLLVQIAAYILFITLLVHFSTKVLWIVYALFIYRLTESTFTYAFLLKYFKDMQVSDYYIIIIAITMILYTITMVIILKVPALKYIVLILLIIYIMMKPQYGLSEVFLFKDYLAANGMWNLDFWIQQIKSLFTMENNAIIETFEKIMSNITGFLKRLFT